MAGGTTGNSAKAELIGTFIETLAYGAYFVIFLQCVSILWRKFMEGRPTIVLSVTALIIFVLTTIHFVMDVVRATAAYTDHMEIAGYPIQYYHVVRRSLDLIKSGSYVSMTIVADALILYRSYVVWGRHWTIVVLPMMLFLADVGLGVYAMVLLIQVRPGQNALMAKVTDRVKYFYLVTLALNLLCTALIAYKIWKVRKEVNRYTPNAAPRNGSGDIILIIVESAAAYIGLLVAMIVMSETKSAGVLAMLDLISPCMAIIFSMVIIRFSVDRTKWDSTKISTNTGIYFVTNPSIRSPGARRHTDDRTTVDHGGIKVDTFIVSESESTYKGQVDTRLTV